MSIPIHTEKTKILADFRKKIISFLQANKNGNNTFREIFEQTIIPTLISAKNRTVSAQLYREALDNLVNEGKVKVRPNKDTSSDPIYYVP